MLQPLMFGSKSSMDEFAVEFSSILKRHGALVLSKPRLKESVTQTIEFLDTEEEVLRQNNFLLRHRSQVSDDKAELTLKCRAPDPFLALETRITPADNKKGKSKLEEDIGPPFTSRLSRSITMPIKKKLPKTISDCFSIFVGLESPLREHGGLRLKRVGDTTVYEEVFSGLMFQLADQVTETALILWRLSPKGRLALVEFSFRYKVKNCRVSRPTALSFSELFDAVQSLDWAASRSITKTKYLYGSRLD